MEEVDGGWNLRGKLLGGVERLMEWRGEVVVVLRGCGGIVKWMIGGVSGVVGYVEGSECGRLVWSDVGYGHVCGLGVEVERWMWSGSGCMCVEMWM